MLIKEVFATKIQEKIEPVVKVGELANEAKLAQELNSYVVTPKIEEYLENFLEHYTDTFYKETGEIGVWISGYFGSGKSYLAKILGLLTENRQVQGIDAVELFESRLDPDSSRTGSIKRHLSRMSQCDTQVMAFNINSLTDSKTSHLSRILLSQFYQSKGYSSNLLYASVIESEFDNAFKKYDVIVIPTVPKLPHKLGAKLSVEEEYAYDTLSVLANLAEVPAISVPAGEIKSIPVGLQIMCAVGQDKKMLKIAKEFEQNK